MSGLLDSIDRRTNLVGKNRLELLLFYLQGRQTYGINVFKVQEVLTCPRFRTIPDSHSYTCGVTSIRGTTLPIIDLSYVIEKKRSCGNENSIVIITEYNRSVQGFLVSGVSRIVNMNWADVHAPPKSTGKNHYLTAVANMDNTMIEILDVEKILAEITGLNLELKTKRNLVDKNGNKMKFMIVDDSSVARKQISKTLEQMGIDCLQACNGKEAIDILTHLADEGIDVSKEFSLVISDIEMPEMDGYRLTTEIRGDARLAPLIVLLHTSLSGVFNEQMVRKVGADKFVPKFKADELADEIENLLVEMAII